MMAEDTDPLTAPEVEQEEAPTLNPETADMGELRRELEKRVYAEGVSAWDEETIEAEPEDEPVAAAEEDSEPVGDDDPSDTVVQAEPAEPAEIEPEIAVTPELLLARIEEAEARSKHFESLLGQRAGADGYWKRRAEQLERGAAADRRAPDDGDYGGEREQRPVERAPAHPDSHSQFLVELAVKEALRVTARADFTLKDGSVDPEFTAIVQRRKAEFDDAISTTDPMYAGTQTKALMSSVWSEYDVVQKRRHREEIERKTSSNREKLTARRRVAASASPGARAPKSAKPLDPMKMPLDELRKRLESGRIT